jgi:hypothetical protein
MKSEQGILIIFDGKVQLLQIATKLPTFKNSTLK